MKINFVIPFAGLSGGNRVIATYAQLLAERGHQVRVVSQPKRASGIKPFIKKTLGHKQPPLPPFTFFDNAHPNVHHTVLDKKRPVVDADLPDADVTIATWWETAPWVAELRASKGAKVYFMQDYGAPGQELEKLIPTWRLPLHIITISSWLSDLVYHCVNRQTDLAFNGVDLEFFSAKNRKKQAKPTVGFIYRSANEKGADIMLEAVRLARKEIPDLQLRGFGPRPPSPPISLISDGDFKWMVDDSEIPGMYSQCDCWLFGTRREGFGLPILEAMACGTPVVASPAGAAREILNQGGGTLVGNEAPEEMATALVKILQLAPDDWQTLSSQAREVAEQFTWKKACDQFESGILNAINGSASEADEAIAI